MRSYALTDVRDDVLLRNLASITARECATTAVLLAHLGEVDARKLYLPAGHASMFAFCVDQLGFSEDAAYKRITAARAARRFPELFVAVEEGRLHLTALRLLAPHLTAENVEELVAAATHRRKSEIEEFLARRFPPATLGAAPAPARATLKPMTRPQLAPGRVAAAKASGQLDFGRVETPTPTPTPSPAPVPAPEQFVLQVTIGRGTRGKLLRAQALLGHSIPSGDVAQVLDRALDVLVTQLEKRKFAATERPRSRPVVGKSTRVRHVPAQVRRAVWERDGGRCSFVGTGGKRCEARRLLEFDHVEPVARGGRATIDGMRLRCRAHNQLEAERAFGVDFMRRKREEARGAAIMAWEAQKSSQSAATAMRVQGVDRNSPRGEFCRPTSADARALADRPGNSPRGDLPAPPSSRVDG